MDLVNVLLLIIDIPILAILSIWLFILFLPLKGKYKEPDCPKVSVIVTTYNEEDNIGKCLDSLISQDYPSFEIIVVDDGSTDKTRGIVKEKGLKLITTKRLGKSKSLNKGISEAEGDIVVFVDADVFLDKGDLKRIISEFDPDVGIVAGTVTISPRNLLEIFQEIDYNLISLLAIKHSHYSFLPPFVSGQILAFRKSVLKEVGGFHADTISEDTDAYLRSLETGWKVRVARTLAKTEGERSLHGLFKQRIRWMLGGIQLFFKHIPKIRGSRFSYPLITLISWPVGTFITLSLGFLVFLHWIDLSSLFNFLIYLTRWFSFIGLFLGWADLPGWGFPITATIGILIGTVAMLLVYVSFVERRDYRLSHWILALFFPIYGWVIMGICGGIAVFEFLLNPRRAFMTK